MKRMKNIYVVICTVLFQILSITNITAANDYSSYENMYHTNLMVKKGDIIYILPSKGIVSYDKSNNSVSNYSKEIGIDEEYKYLAIVTDKEGSLYFTSREYGIMEYDGTLHNYRYTYNNPSPYGLLYTLCFDSDNNIFSGEMLFISYLHPTQENSEIVQLYAVCIESMYQGYPDDLVVMDMEFDSKGNLWMALKAKKYSPNKKDLPYFIKKDSIGIAGLVNNTPYWPYIDFQSEYILKGDKNASSLVVDNDDNIWITADDGIHFYNQTTEKDSLINYTTHSSIPNEHFYANKKDSEGNIWFSSSTTLMKYDGEEFTTYTFSDYNEARSILCDGDIVWILLKNDTLLKFQDNEFEAIDLTPAVTGIEESTTEVSKTKAFVTNEMLNIENAEGINSVVVYDAMGKVITSANANGATSTQIALTSNTKGLLIVKINNDVVKVICD